MRISLLLTLAVLPAAAADLPKEHIEYFETKVRPLLSEHCYQCHSAAAGKTKGGLTLDTKAGWEKGGESGAAIVPGDPDKSLMIRAVRYADDDMQMPPRGEKLEAAEVAVLEEWVRMGAPDPRTGEAKAVGGAGAGLSEAMRGKAGAHWAFQPLAEKPLPAVRDGGWSAGNVIDTWVLAGLEAKGLKPSPGADKRTLIRRVSLDLTGLPPSPEEVLAFVNDDAPDAFAKVVDRLLASPQYGERWGRYWLDVSRYADTRGQVRREQTPLNPNAWTYRDYVIGALNADKPFDQFIREQIAADLLPGGGENKSTLAALGFLTQGDQFNGQRPDIINDQIDVVTKGFLGLTVSCARCHDHFFDPVTQRDYYALAGVFNSCFEPETKPVAASPADAAAMAEYERKRRETERDGRRKLIGEMDRIASVFNRNAGLFLGLAGTDRRSPEFLNAVRAAKIDGRLVAELSQGLQRRMQLRKNRRASLDLNPTIDLWAELSGLPAGAWPERAAAVVARTVDDAAGLFSNRAVREAFRGKRPASLDEARGIYEGIFRQADALYQTESAAFRKDHPGRAFPGVSDAAFEEVRTAVLDPGMFLERPLDAVPRGVPREVQDLAAKITGDLAKFDVSHPGAPGRANVLYDDSRPANARVLLRGQVQSPGPEVPRSFLEVLSDGAVKPFTKGSGRLELAEAVASGGNPLTPRVIVNRVWQHHFGSGFVASPDDLGVQSEVPSHPELLDVLAGQFIRNGWSLKKLHREILLSKTWQQASEPDPAMAQVDPFNRQLWRQNVRKLDFEALRDSVLSMGGQLDLTMGGHPVNIESEPYSQRRSVYGFIDRNEMAEFLRHFDVANPSLPTGRRHETIVPQQALFRMNSLLVIEQARNIVDREEFRAADNDEARVRALYEIIYQRWPKPAELKMALAFITALPADERMGVAGGGDGAPAVAGKEAGPATRADGVPLTRQQVAQRLKQRLREEIRAKAMAAAQNRRGTSGIKEAVRDPAAEKVDRSPLDAWEKFAHALLMTNEMAYVN